MFPFIDPVKIRVKNNSNKIIKVGFTTLDPGAEGDVDCRSAYGPPLRSARDLGVEYVGIVIDDRLYNLVLADKCPKGCGCDPGLCNMEDTLDVNTTSEEPLADDAPEVALEQDARVDDLMAHTKAELVAIAEDLGLSTTGNKSDLVERIVANDDTT